jgi:hypothetical protein
MVANSSQQVHPLWPLRAVAPALLGPGSRSQGRPCPPAAGGGGIPLGAVAWASAGGGNAWGLAGGDEGGSESKSCQTLTEHGEVADEDANAFHLFQAAFAAIALDFEGGGEDGAGGGGVGEVSSPSVRCRRRRSFGRSSNCDGERFVATGGSIHQPAIQSGSSAAIRYQNMKAVAGCGGEVQAAIVLSQNGYRSCATFHSLNRVRTREPIKVKKAAPNFVWEHPWPQTLNTLKHPDLERAWNTRGAVTLIGIASGPTTSSGRRLRGTSELTWPGYGDRFKGLMKNAYTDTGPQDPQNRPELGNCRPETMDHVYFDGDSKPRFKGAVFK